MKPDKNGKPTLESETADIRRMLQDAAVGPLFAAIRVMRIVDNWAEYEGQTTHALPGQWLRKEIHRDQGVDWYKRRAAACVKLGRAASSRLHHAAAVWIVGNVPDHHIPALALQVSRLFRDNGSMYVTASQAKKAARAIMRVHETLKRIRECPSCKKLMERIGRLEEQVRSLGGEPIE